MNRCVLIGRLTKDPDVRWTQGAEQMCIARYTLAIDRPTKDKVTDFISCITFGKNAEFADKYLHKGMKVAVEGRIQTGSYTNKDGLKVYTTDVVVDKHEFCESANNNAQSAQPEAQPTDWNEGFMHIPESADDAGLPWN